MGFKNGILRNVTRLGVFLVFIWKGILCNVTHDFFLFDRKSCCNVTQLIENVVVTSHNFFLFDWKSCCNVTHDFDSSKTKHNFFSSKMDLNKLLLLLQGTHRRFACWFSISLLWPDRSSEGLLQSNVCGKQLHSFCKYSRCVSRSPRWLHCICWTETQQTKKDANELKKKGFTTKNNKPNISYK